MDYIIAYCGLNCSTCEAYIATKNDDLELRRKTAEFWSKEYDAEIKPEDIVCDGCLDKEGKHIGHWTKCELRTCNEGKGLENCAHCDDYICDKLNEYIKMSDEIKNNLKSVRGSVSDK